MPKAMPMMANARAVFRGGHVRDVRLGDAEVARGEPVDDPAEEDDQEIWRESEDEKAGEGADLARHQDRLSADVVGKLAQNGAGDELAERVGADEDADHGGAGAEMLRVEGEQRQHDRQPEDVDDDDEEDGEERRLHRLNGSGGNGPDKRSRKVKSNTS